VSKPIAKSDTRDLADRLLATVNAEKPTKAQLAELRQALTEAPELVNFLGDLSAQLMSNLVKSLSRHPGLHMVVQAHLDHMAKALGSEQAAPLEKLLIDHVLIAWLRLQSVEWTYQTAFAESMSLEKALYLEKRLSLVQRRYLQAVESLVRVRRLLARAPVQINIAQQQVVQNVQN
jgi:hypothetical protein